VSFKGFRIVSIKEDPACDIQLFFASS